MKITSGDKSFEFDIEGNRAIVKVNIAKFRGVMSVDDLPPQVSNVKDKILDVACLVEAIAGEVRAKLEDKKPDE
ncbi:MAG: hypothetical protein PHI12_08230 [Dehalococcoidales bacterium]|nr:hypothetical protein [Dehalococcoidales bacterium]